MENEVYLFAKQVKETDIGTEVVIGFLQKKYPHDIFINVEDDKEYQKIDVDYLWRTHKGKEFLLEIKVDSYLTSNLFYEKFSCYELKTQGCMEKTKANFIAYYYSAKDILYILNPEKLRKYVNKYEKWLTPKFIPNSTYHAMGYTIPLKELGSDIIIAKFENIKE